jgi:hypothetical protein
MKECSICLGVLIIWGRNSPIGGAFIRPETRSFTTLSQRIDWGKEGVGREVDSVDFSLVVRGESFMPRHHLWHLLLL